MRNPNLASDEAHLWCVRLDLTPDESTPFYETLSNDELDRSARFRFDVDGNRFAVAHGVLRELLGRYVGRYPGDLRFVHNPFGKPELSPEYGRRLRFNLSHSSDLALVAVALDGDVGVDVERVHADMDFADIAQRFFSAEEIDRLSRVPGALYAERFLDCWTRKEAYMKARGQGFTIPPESFSGFDLDQAWSVFPLRPARGYIGAVVVEGAGRRLVAHEWPAADAIVSPRIAKGQPS